MRRATRSPSPRRGLRALVVGTALAMASPLMVACGSNSSQVVINLYNGPQENMATIVNRCNDLAHGAYRIKLNQLPRAADGQREQLVRRLAAGDSGLDVMGMDGTWVAELAEAGWIREWTGQNKRQAVQDTLAKPLKTAQWNDKLYAVPYNTNVQLLWYRSDLVKTPPKTWDELINASEMLARQGRSHYAEVTGAQYEGLVVWFNALVTSAGGSITSDDGKKVTLNDKALQALKVMHRFANSKAADPSLSNTQEQEANLAFQGGSAAFQLNWPFVYAATRDANPTLLKKLRWAPYPGINGPGESPLGGAVFAIGKYSKHPKEAFQAAFCLRDPGSQKIAAVKDGLPPTIRSVYDDPEVKAAYPMRDAILAALSTAGERPRTPFYQNVSTTVSTVLSPPRSITPQQTLDRLRSEVTDALNSKGVLP
ncbi:MAG: ABC transporter substrate-binding protein [Mycobacteriales bacterium]